MLISNARDEFHAKHPNDEKHSKKDANKVNLGTRLTKVVTHTQISGVAHKAFENDVHALLVRDRYLSFLI